LFILTVYVYVLGLSILDNARYIILELMAIKESRYIKKPVWIEMKRVKNNEMLCSQKH